METVYSLFGKPKSPKIQKAPFTTDFKPPISADDSTSAVREPAPIQKASSGKAPDTSSSESETIPQVITTTRGDTSSGGGEFSPIVDNEFEENLLEQSLSAPEGIFPCMT